LSTSPAANNVFSAVVDFSVEFIYRRLLAIIEEMPMTTTTGRIIPNNSPEAYSVLEVRVKPVLAPEFLLVAFDIGNGQVAHNTTDKGIIEGIPAKEIEKMQEKGGAVECDYTNPQQGRYHLTAIRSAPSA
jgi:hypothetical protein